MNKKLTKKYIVGIDEVGRGSLAGPVAAAAVLLEGNLPSRLGKSRLRDSKKLTPAHRELWFEYFKEKQVPYAVSFVAPRVIDRINISKSANLAARRAFLRLVRENNLPLGRVRVYLDGGLTLYIDEKLKNLKTYNLKTIVRGDEKIKAIKIASIIAKVSRDRRMRRLHRKFPQYDFPRHKGYGTKIHAEAIINHGISPLHRAAFVRRFN